MVSPHNYERAAHNGIANATAAFLKAMDAQGIRPLEPIGKELVSGALIRFRAEGDKPGRKNGWARLFPDGGRAGVFGHFRLGISTSWRADGNLHALSDSERRAIVATIRRQEAERVCLWERVTSQAARDWSNASPANPAHAYLQAKHLAPFGIRQLGQTLLVPMWDAKFRLRNLQRIAPDGQKRFFPGGQTGGLFWHHGLLTITPQPGVGPLVIAEGFATAAAIHEATGYAVISAMSAKNLEAVAQIARNRFPSREIIIAADFDGHLPENLGALSAEKAAQGIGAKIALPVAIGPDRPALRLAVDFADISRRAACALIEAARKTKGASHE